MKLKHIDVTSCPTCGCFDVVGETIAIEEDAGRIRTHTLGGQWETRTFACGYRVQYEPNLRNGTQPIPRYHCRKDPANMEIQQKRSSACALLIVEVEKLDVDETFKTDLRSHMHDKKKSADYLLQKSRN